MYRDVRALEEAGVPVLGEAGIGYKLMEGYKLPPVMFNEDEASALLTASKLVQSKTDAGISKHYATALDKIKAVLRLSEKDHMEEIDEHIMVMEHPAIVVPAACGTTSSVLTKGDRRCICNRNKIFFN